VGLVTVIVCWQFALVAEHWDVIAAKLNPGEVRVVGAHGAAKIRAILTSIMEPRKQGQISRN
jgi:hypothetical protein